MKSTEKNNIISDFYEKIKIITPNDSYHYFFGYYDMRATGNGINLRHLAHRVKFMDRLPDENDVCELGYLEDGYRHILAINLETGESKSILKGKTVIPECPDIRCDLHARCVFDEKFVSFDTTHNGRCEIAIFPISEIKA